MNPTSWEESVNWVLRTQTVPLYNPPTELAVLICFALIPHAYRFAIDKSSGIRVRVEPLLSEESCLQ